MKLGRRGFLKAAAAAPIAAPVVAQNVASRIGAGSIGLASGIHDKGNWAPDVASTGRYYEMLKLKLSKLDGGELDAEIAEEVRHQARVLDCDLASMRSVSASFAYQVQRARLVEETKRQERGRLMRNLAEDAKRSVLG